MKERDARVKEGNTSYNKELSFGCFVLLGFFFPCPKQTVGPSAVLKIGDKITNNYDDDDNDDFIVVTRSQGHCFCFVTLF